MENLIEETYLYDVNKFKESKMNLWMCFPSVYTFSLSSLGYLWICKEFDEMNDVEIERVCSDTKSTKFQPKDLDLIGFSFSFDLDFLNIFKMLDKYNIPIKASERNESMPLIFAGGPVVTANPTPYNDFFDFVIVGDGEGINCKLAELIIQNKDKSKDEILKIISKLEGIYVPKISEKVKKVTANLSTCVYTPILSEKSFFKNTFIIEISRGCSNCCAFCLASYLNLPQRFIDYTEIIRVLEMGLEYTNKIALLGAYICAHPDFDKICQFILDKIKGGKEIEMSISSLRADRVSPIMIETLVKTGQRTATIAIEAGSERLRKVINKNLSREQLYETVKIAKENGLKGFKIYAMFGIPTETQEDLVEMVKLAKDLKKDFKGFDFSYAFSTFVPKAHTPFQWCGREDSKSLDKKLNYLKKEFHKLGLGAKFSSIKWDYFQTLLSRGGAELGEYIYDVYKNGGNLGAFKNSATDKFDIDEYVLKDFDLNKVLPWDCIELPTKKEVLLKENKRLLQ